MEMRLKEKELDLDNETQRRDHEFRLVQHEGSVADAGQH